MYGLSRKKRIKRKKIFEILFREGKSLYKYPVKMIYVHTELPEEVPFQVAFAVSKKKFKRSVRRNRIKRLMRESFRLEQTILQDIKPTAFMFIYVSDEEEKFDFLRNRMRELLLLFKEKTGENGSS